MDLRCYFYDVAMVSESDGGVRIIYMVSYSYPFYGHVTAGQTIGDVCVYDGRTNLSNGEECIFRPSIKYDMYDDTNCCITGASSFITQTHANKRRLFQFRTI